MTTHDEPGKRIRFAIYCRTSSEILNEMSLDAQERCCREAIAKLGGTVMAVYADSPHSGESLERGVFDFMWRDTARSKFDALMVWKSDRLSRDPQQAAAITSLCQMYHLTLHVVGETVGNETNSL